MDSPYIDSGLNLAVADPGKGSGGPGFPPYFSTKMRPEGPKKFILETPPPPTPPPLSEGLDPPLGSLSSNVFERCTSTGSGLFSFFDGGFAQIFSQIASITVKKLRSTNFISSRHVKRENTSLPVDVRRSKTSLLKRPNIIMSQYENLECCPHYE